MLSLLLAPAVLGEFIEPFVSLSASPTDPMAELKMQLEKMRSSMERPTPVANPCAEDMKRYGCSDAACLKRKATALDAACMMMIAQPIVMPSPSPMPLVAPGLLKSQGVFSMTSTDNEGHVERISGPLSSLLGGVALPRSAVVSSRPPMLSPSVGGMFSMFPPEIMEQMLSPGLAAIIGAAERQMELEEEEEEEASSHPCAREVSICTHETGSTSRAAIEGCLVKHFESLSSECRCFVHHITDGKVPAASKPTAAQVAPKKKAKGDDVVTVRAVPLTETTIFVDDMMVEELPARSRGHSLSCLLFFTLFFLLFFLAVRACCRFLCCPARTARRVVVVPPEAAVIKTVDPPPMLISEMKAVQVAKPIKA